MKRVIEILDLVKIDLSTQIIHMSIKSKTLKEIVDECEDTFEVGTLKEDLKDINEIINDSKLDLSEIDLAINLLSLSNNDIKTEKRP